MEGRVLTVAGSDSGGGAGVQADIKTITALGGYASTALTALTAQNTVAIAELLPVDPFFVERQMEVVLDDIGADAIKLGMLLSRTTVELVSRVLTSRAGSIPVVLDPVCRSTSGYELLDAAGLVALRDKLLPLCALVTPNFDEAEALTGVEVSDEASMHAAADALLLRGAAAVLITGGHGSSDTIVDLLRTADGEQHRFESPRQQTRATHGTGCTLSAAIATFLAQGMTLQSSVEQAIEYVQAAIRWAQPLGNGRHGPLDHAFPLRQRPSEAKVH